MANGLVIPRPGVKPATIVPNINMSGRALPGRISTSIFEQRLQLDADQAAKFPGDRQLLRFSIARKQLALSEGDVVTLVIRGFPHRLYDKLGHLLKPDFRNAEQANYVFDMDQVAAVNLNLEIASLAGATGANGGKILIDLSIFVTHPAFTPQLTLDDDSSSFAVDQKSVLVAPLQFLSNTQPVERLFVCELPANEPTVKELEAALKLMGAGHILHKVPPDVSKGDAWLQDQFQVGFCEDDRGNRLHVVLHLPRLRKETADVEQPNLSTFVDHYFPSRDIGLFRDFWKRDFTVNVQQRGTVPISFRDTYAISLAFTLLERLWDGCMVLFRFIDRRAADVEEPQDIWEKLRYATLLMTNVAREYDASGKQSPQLGERLAFLTDLHQQVRDRFPELYSDAAKAVIKRPDGTSVVDGVLDSKELIRLHDEYHLLHDSVNYGGNIEVAPPADPGKSGRLVIGNSKGRPMDQGLLDFLGTQVAEGALEIDTSWLKVGHVDELITFVPAPRSARKWVVLQNSSELALRILLEAVRFHFQDDKLEIDDTDWGTINGATDLLGNSGQDGFVSQLLRGRYWEYYFDRKEGPVPQLSPPQMYLASARNLHGPSPHVRFDIYGANISPLEVLRLEQRFRMNRELAETRLLALSSQLEEELGAEPLFLPAIFDIPEGGMTETFLPNLINMQVVGSHLLVPRPGGPRLRVKDAVTVLMKVLDPPLHSSLTASFVQQQGLAEQVLNIRNYPETDYHQEIPSNEIFLLHPDAPPDFEEQLLQRNRTQFTPNGTLKPGWRRLTIPEQTVDLFEFYTAVLLASVGVQVHWIDTWYYHIRHGGLHCGTNSIRKI